MTEPTDIRKGLVGVVADYTAVSKVNPDTNSLLYRGYPVQELAATQSFEAVAYLLWYGELPSDEQTLLSFKGIGAYTAGAIRSFAFGQRAAILDTNVARVLFRVFVAAGDDKAHATRKRLWAISEALVPYKHVFDFNQALMDLGATVCVARKPRCPECPMKRSCRSFASLSVRVTKNAARVKSSANG